MLAFTHSLTLPLCIQDIDNDSKASLRSGMGLLGRRPDHGPRTTVSGWLRKKFTRKGKDGNKGATEDVAELPEVNESTEFIQPEFDLESVGDLGYVCFSS